MKLAYNFLSILTINLNLIVNVMRNKYNSNDSLFSIEYKIPYEKSSIEEHL